MIALEITQIKDFMNTLLCTDTFDKFLLQEAVIQGAASYVIDGHINKGFYSDEELSQHGLSGFSILPFSMLRPNCFHLIKGKKTPSSFRFLLLLSPENMAKTIISLNSEYTPEDISGMFLNIKYQNQMLTLTTGVSYRIFSTNKCLDEGWDRLVLKFLNQHEIKYEEL